VRFKFNNSIRVLSLAFFGFAVTGCVGDISTGNSGPRANIEDGLKVIGTDPAFDQADVPINKAVTLRFSEQIDPASPQSRNIEILDGNGNRLTQQGMAISVKTVQIQTDEGLKFVDEMKISPPGGYWMPDQEIIISWRKAPNIGDSDDAVLRGIWSLPKADRIPMRLASGSLRFFTGNTVANTPQQFLRIRNGGIGKLITDLGNSTTLYELLNGLFTTNSRAKVELLFSEPFVHNIYDAANFNVTSEIPPTPICISQASSSCYPGLFAGSVDARLFNSDLLEQARQASRSASEWYAFLRNGIFQPVTGTVRSKYGRKVLEFTPDASQAYPNSDPNSPSSVRVIVVAAHGLMARQFADVSPRLLWSGYNIGGVPITGFAMLGFIHFAGWQPINGFPDPSTFWGGNF
jgi:hypothetical protein